MANKVNALYWLIAIPFGLIVAGLVADGIESLAKFHREGMERVKKLDR